MGGCQRNHNDSLVPKTNSEYVNTSPLALEMNYEMETVSFQETLTADGEVADADDLDPLDAVRAVPVVDRQKIDLKIFKDGSSQWTITKQTPRKNDVVDLYDKDVPPDLTPETALTKIINNVAYFYDKDGNLLHSYDLKEAAPDDFKDLIEQLENGCLQSNSIFSRLTGFGIAGCNMDYSQQGTVSEVGNGIIAVRIEPKSSSVARVSNADDLTTIAYIDTVQNRPLGTELFDKSGHLVMLVYLKYNDDEAKNLEATHQELFETDEETGTNYKLISDIFYENVSITNHLSNE